MAGNDTPKRVLRPRPARSTTGTPTQPARRKRATAASRASSVPPSTHSALRLECVLLTPRGKARHSTVARGTAPGAEAASSSRTPVSSAAAQASSLRGIKLGRLLTAKTSKKRRRASTPPRSLQSPAEARRGDVATGLLTPAPSQDWQMGRADLVFERSRRITVETTESATARRTGRPAGAPVDGDAGLTVDGSQTIITEAVASVTAATRRTRSRRAPADGDAGRDAAQTAAAEAVESASTRRTRSRRAPAGAGTAARTTQVTAKTKGKGRAAADARAPDPTTAARAESGSLPDSDGPTARPEKRRRLQDHERHQKAAHPDSDIAGDAGVRLNPPPPAPATRYEGRPPHGEEEEHGGVQPRAAIDDSARTKNANDDEMDERDEMDVDASIPGAVRHQHQAGGPLAGLQLQVEARDGEPPRQKRPLKTIPARRSAPSSASPTPAPHNESMTVDPEPEPEHSLQSVPDDADRAPSVGVGELLYPSSAPDSDGAAELAFWSAPLQPSPPPTEHAQERAKEREIHAPVLQPSPPPKRPAELPLQDEGGAPAIAIDIAGDDDAHDGPDDDDALDIDLDLHLDPESLSAESNVDFQLLELLDAATLSWLRTDIPVPSANAAPDADTVAVYLPPGVHHLVENMKHALRTEAAARARAEARCALAMRAHLAAEQRVSVLEAACAALANEQRLWTAADAASFLREGGAPPPPPPHQADAGAGAVDSGGDARTNGDGGGGKTPASTPAPARRAPPAVGEHTQTVLTRAAGACPRVPSPPRPAHAPVAAPAAVQDMLRRWVPLPDARAAEVASGRMGTTKH